MSDSKWLQLRPGLEALYERYNKKEFVHPDPLEFLYDYPPDDREIVGLIASSLAYGRVWSILNAVENCLYRMDNEPVRFLKTHSRSKIEILFNDFKHRFTNGHEMSAFLTGIKKALEIKGSIQALFDNCERYGSSIDDGHERTVTRLAKGVSELLTFCGLSKSYLLPDPAKKSACKRLFLYLRWMVRSDDVDPGGWTVFSPSDLIVPLDTHMFNIAKALGFTERKQANLATALEITKVFSTINPEDPVKYDFVLTRFGIRDELDRDQVPELVRS